MQLSKILAGKGTHVITIHPAATVFGLASVLTENHIGAAVVSDDDQRVLGVASERDVAHALARQRDVYDLRVSAVMSTPATVLTAHHTVEEAMEVMTLQRIRHIPIVDADDALIGIVSIGDLVKWRLDQLEADRSALVDYITRGG
ncbi:MAG: CBS domain-containing protein [Candidatus Nanopelagicales bacterium]|nr:CBS domain-containing protein [Candidatus Nanopelagicales bacterium]